MTTEIRILIADDHPIFRKGLRQVIEFDRHLKVVAEAEDGAATLELLGTCQPDVAVLDVDMPVKDGFEVVRLISARQLPVRVIFLTMHKDERFLNAALDLGVNGYVLKDSATNEIVGGIKAVAAGQDYVSPALSTFLLNRSRRALVLTEQMPKLAELTDTEKRVLKMIAGYKTSKEIADALYISPRTVDRHRSNISEKLELKGSHALLKFAIEHHSEL